MMVCDNEINTKTLSVFNLLNRSCTGINRNNKLRAIFLNGINSRRRNAVALTCSVGNIVFDVGSQGLEIKIKGTYRRYAVNIIVTVNGDFMSLLDSGPDAVYRIDDILHEEGIDKHFAFHIHESLCCFNRGVSSVVKKLGNNRIYSEG